MGGLRRKVHLSVENTVLDIEGKVMKLAEQEAEIGKRMEKKQKKARKNALKDRQMEIQNDTLDQEGYPQATMLKSSHPLVILTKARYLSRKKVNGRS